MRAPVTVSLAQVDAKLGDPSANLETHLEALGQARREGAGLVVFPELALTGYLLRDLTSEIALRADAPLLAKLGQASRGLDLVTGWIEESDEHVFHNVAGYFSDGKLLHRHRKVYPVDYGMFEEARYWAAGDEVAAFDTPWGRAGMLVCEDVWHPSTSWLLFADRADVVIVPSASPARGMRPRDGEGHEIPGSTRTWDSLLRNQSAAFNLWSVYVNRVGVEDGVSFAGHSRVVDPFGEVVLKMGLEAGLATTVLDPDRLRRRRTEAPMLRDERLDVTLGNLQRIVRGRFGD